MAVPISLEKEQLLDLNAAAFTHEQL